MQLELLEIGGYFEFSLSNLNQFPYPEAIRYHSARSAFYSLLQHAQIKKIWMPKLICDSMLEPLSLLDIKIYFYDLQPDFYPMLPHKLKDDEYLLYVNYFGLCTLNQEKLLSVYSSQQIIFDHSQAFFVPPFECFATIYSPRKFLPVAEGGLLISEQKIVPSYYPRTVDEMAQQYQHGFIRRLSNASQAYGIFKNNENIFNDCLPKRMSEITKDILDSIDYSHFKEKRLENFKFLHHHLGSFNQLQVDLDQIKSPLTYPLLLKNKISDLLIKDKIYTPTYWSDSMTRLKIHSFEYGLVSNTTHLICDQRYSLKEMQFQINKVQDYLE